MISGESVIGLGALMPGAGVYLSPNPLQDLLAWGSGLLFPSTESVERFPQPPMPVPPVVPTGGYVGPITDPGAVDEIIGRTWEKQGYQTKQFFDVVASRETKLPWILIVVTLGGFIMLGRKR